MEKFNNCFIPKYTHQQLRHQSIYCVSAIFNCTGISCKECIFGIDHLRFFDEWLELELRKQKLERILK